MRWSDAVRRRLYITDSLVVVTAVALGWIMQQLTATTDRATLRDAMLLALLWLVLLAGTRTRGTDVLGAGSTEYRRILQATCLAFGAVAIARLIMGWEGNRTLLLTAFVMGLAELLVGRWSWRTWLLGRRVAGQCLARSLVVGCREDVERFVLALDGTTTHQYQVVAVTVTDSGRHAPVDVAGHRVVGTAASVAKTATQIGADTIIVVGENPANPSFVRDLYCQLEGSPARLVLAHRAAEVLGDKAQLHPVRGLPLLTMDIPTYRGGQLVYKRALDILCSSLALLVIAVMTPVIALLIKLDSRGPVFFSQRRVGRDGTYFTMYKFRTMVTTAEADLGALKESNEGAGPLFKLKSDPRVTRMGRVLRRLSLDELPQFWNVLKGDMSVVGPRPPLPDEATTYDGQEARRLYMKPGITGLWQVSGRSDLSWEDSVALDLNYVEHWSVAKDLQIMWRTGRAMIRPQGAY
ncbi:MAG: sugar transferase [Galactobacter sp.]